MISGNVTLFKKQGGRSDEANKSTVLSAFWQNRSFVHEKKSHLDCISIFSFNQTTPLRRFNVADTHVPFGEFLFEPFPRVPQSIRRAVFASTPRFFLSRFRGYPSRFAEPFSRRSLVSFWAVSAGTPVDSLSRFRVDHSFLFEPFPRAPASICWAVLGLYGIILIWVILFLFYLQKVKRKKRRGKTRRRKRWNYGQAGWKDKRTRTT